MRVYYFLSIIILFSSCKKEEDRSCFKSTGEVDTSIREIENFNHLFLGGHIKFELVQDTVNKLVLKGGKNLLNGITSEVVDNQLIIENLNKCAFLRSYDDAVFVEVHFKDIVNIEYEGTFPTFCRDTIFTTDLTLAIQDGAGPIELKLNCNSINASIIHGWGSFVLSGFTNHANLKVRSNGFGDAYGLHVLNELNVVSSTVSDVKVRANGCLLRAETNQTGNILYKGIPSAIEFNQYGAGQLIDEN